jgi:diaminohydroxyphosphoribosylaminopyrimidine deaminase/5-amino-6-(5-phosphoribosylamino)uracil reductase
VNKTEQDIEYTRRALELAAAGIGQVSPNPLVGCVIVSAEGKVAGEGTYTYDGVTHAEVIALEQAGESARGGTAYVSLEPHHHQGRTRPCTEALIEAGIVRVVSPVEDPNPLVSGRGFNRLREAGVKVTTGVLADEASRLNEKFICWHKQGRPFVHLKLAMSLDGRISLTSSVSTALSGETALRRVHELRHEHDAILVGANTVIADDPRLTDRSNKPRRRPLVRIVLDNRLRTPGTAKVVATAPAIPTILFTNSTNGEKLDTLRAAAVDVVDTPYGSRDLTAVLNELKEREIQSVLVEGGSEIAGAFVDARLVDKITLLASPLIIGGREAPVAIGGQGADSIAEAMRLHDVSCTMLDSDIEITGYPKGHC